MIEQVILGMDELGHEDKQRSVSRACIERLTQLQHAASVLPVRKGSVSYRYKEHQEAFVAC